MSIRYQQIFPVWTIAANVSDKLGMILIPFGGRRAYAIVARGHQEPETAGDSNQRQQNQSVVDSLDLSVDRFTTRLNRALSRCLVTHQLLAPLIGHADTVLFLEAFSSAAC